jgi:hypothetical protein
LHLDFAYRDKHNAQESITPRKHNAQESKEVLRTTQKKLKTGFVCFDFLGELGVLGG